MSVDEAVRQVLEATERKGDPSWDWELEERTIRKQCYDFICKNPELAHALPDDLRETFHAAIAKGRTSIKIVCPSRTKKWQVRGWGGPEGTEDAPALMGGFVLYDANNLEPAEWIIKEMLPASGVLILPGQWGTYKTTTLLDMSYCIMTGTPFAGKYPVKRQGAVMLYALEGFKAVDRRLRAIAEFAGNGNAPLPLYKSDCCPPLSRPEAAGEIIAVIKNVDENAQAVLGMPVRVLWIDTYSNAAGHSLSGDDNDRAATQKVFNTLRTIGRETGVLVAVIDHFGKIAESRTTGSAGKEGNADAVLANMAERELNGTLGNLRMMVRKQRDGRAGFELPFEAEVVDLGSQDEDGDPITGVALKWEAERLAQEH